MVRWDTQVFTGNSSIPLAPRDVVNQCLATAIVFLCLVLVWSGLRVWASRIRQTSTMAEDSLYYISVTSYLAMIISHIVCVYRGGVGYHMFQLGRYHVKTLSQTLLAVQVFYCISMCTSKWSILWMLKRIFPGRTFSYFTWAIIILQACWAVTIVLTWFLVCTPVRKNWDPEFVGGQCGDRIAGYTAVSVLNIIVDALMFALALPMIWKLQIRKPHKIALCGIFSVSFLSVVFAILRLVSLRTLNFRNISYSIPRVLTWTSAECGAVILVACTPLLRPIFDIVFGRVLSGNRRRSQDSLKYTTKYTTSDAMQPHAIRSMKKGFITLDDSDENLELTQVPDRSVTVRETQEQSSDEEQGDDANGPKVGITVEREVSQLFPAHLAEGRRAL